MHNWVHTVVDANFCKCYAYVKHIDFYKYIYVFFSKLGITCFVSLS